MGLTLVAQGVAYLDIRNSLTFKTLATSALCLASGISLVLGLLTPIACSLIVLGSFGLAFSWLPPPGQFVISGSLATINMIVMAMAVAVLGPGAYSLDSRMFGRHEIVIPAGGGAILTDRKTRESLWASRKNQ